MYRILSLKISNHPYLDDTEISFVDNKGNSFSNIIFAGENGCGKTTILEILHSIFGASSSEYPQLGFNAEIKFSSNDTHYLYSVPKFFSNGRNWKQIDNTNSIEIDLQTRPEFWNKAKAFYTPAEINFSPDVIRAIENKDIDTISDTAKTVEIPKDLATSITQLLRDINAKDSIDLAEWVKNNPGIIPPDDVKEERMKRFNEAFQYIFGENLKFYKTVNNTVLFKKGGNEIAINKLSSGEKQIVFRGGSLLQNLGKLKESILLIDEPELSIHPKWQEKLLGFYKELFMQGGNQTAQIFIATHSDHILKSALEDDDTIIIKLALKNNNSITPEKISKRCPGQILPRITIGEVKWRIFDLPTIDFHCNLFGHLMSVDIKDAGGNVIDPITASKIRGEKALDKVLRKMNIPLVPDSWINTRQKPDLTIPVYIRNQIHHPESKDRNEELDYQELYNSINLMIPIVKNSW